MPVVSARARSLVFPPFDILNQKAIALRQAGHRVLSLGQAVPGFPPPPAALEAASLALTDPDVHRYSADAGLLSLREAICDRFREHLHVEATPDDVIVTAGGNQAFMLTALTLLDPGDDVVLAAPYFVNHEMAIRAAGGVPIEAPAEESSGFRPRWSDIESQLTPRTRAVILCSPSNPTGAVIERDELERTVYELSRRGITLISDETYLHFVFEGTHNSAASIHAWKENVVVVGTFSKSFAMTGWRVGYVMANPRVCEQAIKIQDAMIICAPVISQKAVEAAIRDDWNYITRFHGELRHRRTVLRDGIARIPALHWEPAAGGFFAFVRIPDGQDSEQLAAAILDRAHVVTIPGASFGRCGERFLRLSYGAAAVDELVEACSRLSEFFGDLSRGQR
ncbi:MAG: pyridoxal phosphate-dependent aminotransferase [Vicinamibacterales bacterium]